MKEVAYMQISKERRKGFVTVLLSILIPSTGSTMSHALRIDWYIDQYDDVGRMSPAGSLLERALVDRNHVICGSEPPYAIAGDTLDQAMGEVGEMVESLMSNGFNIVETGDFWYSVKLERVWETYDEGRYGEMQFYEDFSERALQEA